MAGFCGAPPESQAKKSRRQGRDGGVLGVSLVDELVGESIKIPARWPGYLECSCR